MKIRILFLLLSLMTGVFLHAQNLSVIGNKNGAPSSLTSAQLKSYFKGDIKTWSNGGKVVLALMKSTTPAGSVTCSKVYEMSCNDVSLFWLKKSTEGNAPVFFNSVADLQNFVAGKPGAIGIIDGSAPLSSVQAITIDGKNSF